MRYHWGLGVGHYHVHHQPTSSLHHVITSQSITNEAGDTQDNQSSNLEPEGTSYSNVDAVGDSDDDLEYISDGDPELGLEDRHLPEEGWQDMDTDGASDGGGHSGSDSEDIEEEPEDYTGC